MCMGAAITYIAKEDMKRLVDSYTGIIAHMRWNTEHFAEVSIRYVPRFGRQWLMFPAAQHRSTEARGCHFGYTVLGGEGISRHS
jgi:hypothetical protein